MCQDLAMDSQGSTLAPGERGGRRGKEGGKRGREGGIDRKWDREER